jgi:hypothetical protein
VRTGALYRARRTWPTSRGVSSRLRGPCTREHCPDGPLIAVLITLTGPMY